MSNFITLSQWKRISVRIIRRRQSGNYEHKIASENVQSIWPRFLSFKASRNSMVSGDINSRA